MPEPDEKTVPMPDPDPREMSVNEPPGSNVLGKTVDELPPHPSGRPPLPQPEPPPAVPTTEEIKP